MFFNNNPNPINIPNNNNLFPNQDPNQIPYANGMFNGQNTTNNGSNLDISYLNNYDTNNYNNFPSNNQINNNMYSNNNQSSNNDPNYNMNQFQNINGNQGNNTNYNANNRNNPSPGMYQLGNTLNSRIGNNELSNNVIENDEKLKKKNLMDGLQEQIQNKKNTKLQELMKKKIEDQKYLSDEYNPFGRNGAGAPLRDNNGKIITKRIALISDNKKINDGKSDIMNNGNNLNLNNLITNLTQKISSYGTENIGNNNSLAGPRYNSARNTVN